jgi:hypothetical protein
MRLSSIKITKNLLVDDKNYLFIILYYLIIDIKNVITHNLWKKSRVSSCVVI